MIIKLQKSLSKNMLLYTALVIAAGLAAGSIAELRWLSGIILPVVFIMIYPMMVNLSLSSLKKIRGSAKPLGEAITLNFVVAPVLMWLLASALISDPKITLALMMLSIAPASSMGLGYIGLAEGHMVSGAIIVAVAFILSIFVYPIAGHYFAIGTGLNVPMGMILKNLTLILIVPLILGVATREYIERKHGAEKFLKVKPYFSTTTLLFLYVLIFIIFASKAGMIMANLADVWMLLPVAVVFYSTMSLLTLFVNKHILSLEYGHHQAVVFTSVSKNVALTIAILVSVFGKEGQYLAVFPAIMSLFQAPFLMIYLKFSRKIRAYLEKEERGVETFITGRG